MSLRLFIACCFDPRLPEGGDPVLSPFAVPTNCFDPRLPEGGDKAREIALARKIVSIHASLREATCSSTFSVRGSNVSIHASLREATQRPFSRGGLHGVSIHASLREATPSAMTCFRGSRFRSTPP